MAETSKQGSKRIIIATGGTGGHIYPALVTAEELRRRGWEILFVGALGTAVPKLTARGFACRDIRITGFVSRTPRQVLCAAGDMFKAFLACNAILRQFRPVAVLGFGGYSSFPSVVAAALRGMPTLIHEQNACPGEANKWLGRVAARVALSFREAGDSFPAGKTVWTGCPVRPLTPGRSRAEALRALGLTEDRKTVLVFGGSQGSRAINAAFADLTGQFSSGPYQFIHLAGLGAGDALRARYEGLSCPHYTADYLERMEDAYAVADVVVARAGAGTVTELGALGIPAVLVPYPHARAHQTANARVLERRGTAVIIQEKDLNPASLGDKIFLLLARVVPVKNSADVDAGDFAPGADRRLADALERLL